MVVMPPLLSDLVMGVGDGVLGILGVVLVMTNGVFLDLVLTFVAFLDIPGVWGLGEGCLFGGCKLLVPLTGPLGDRRVGTISLASFLSYLYKDLFLVSLTS